MILHIFVADKFAQPYIDFLEKHFDTSEHHFFVINKKNRFVFKPNKSLEIYPKMKFFRLNSLFQKSDKVIIHGLFWEQIVLLLALNYKRLSKCHWLIWGGDLYKYYDRKKTWKNRFWHMVRTFAISKIGNLVTYLQEDYKLAQSWYGAKGKYQECLLYPSNVANPIKGESPHDNIVKILVGNSATAANRHADAFSKLLPFKGKIKLYVPLSYGNQKYASSVIAEGNEMFGSDFIPLTDFMPVEEYYKLLKSIDVVVFNHDRQQGMGNIVQLLGMGKKVYIDPKTPQQKLFDDLNIKVFDVNQIQLDPVDLKKNVDIVERYFSEANLIEQWHKILQD